VHNHYRLVVIHILVWEQVYSNLVKSASAQATEISKSPDAKAYPASTEVVAASALAGKIAGPGWYEKPVGWNRVEVHEGEPVEELTVEDTLENLINKFENIIDAGLGSSETLSSTLKTESSSESLTEVLPRFPEKVSIEIVFCDADNVNTDAIYPGKYTHQDDVPREKMAEVCMENYDPLFSNYVKKGTSWYLVLPFVVAAVANKLQLQS
jgi:homoaconitate hydratase